MSKNVSERQRKRGKLDATHGLLDLSRYCDDGLGFSGAPPPFREKNIQPARLNPQRKETTSDVE